jgi:hypothetical protein
LREKRFGFEPEVTAKISRVPGVRIYEVGISYYGRTYAEGKENWSERWFSGHLLHSEVQSLGEVDSACRW